jgi:hypothetical protein
MRRQVAAAIAGGVLLVALGGFLVVRAVTGRNTPNLVAATAKPSTCADAYRLLKLRPSEVTAANPVCLKQSLQLSGEVAGSIAEAYSVSADSVAPASMCAEPRRWDAFPQGLLAFAVNGKGYRLRIAPSGVSEHQPVARSIVAGIVELASITDPSIDWNQASGILELNPDGITGSIDVNLLRDVAGARPVHIAGQWACGAPLPLPSFDTSVPCANFYALNQLQGADVTRMKAGGCNTESLVFTEDIAGQVDHAVTDSVAPRPGYQGDNFCGSVNDQYTATLKFSIGDESFLLDIGAENYGGVGPGQYDARTGGAIGVVLFLGTADPANQGRFVPDEKIFWLGQSGSFIIAPDMKSGTVDAELRAAAAISGSTVHVKGSWRCAS